MKKDIHRPKKQGDKKIRSLNFILGVCLAVAAAPTYVFALEPLQILVIANSDVNESLQLAYYCGKRAVPPENILKIPLGKNLAEQISRQSYNDNLAAAVRKELTQNRKSDEIKCLLTLYGVPIKVGTAAPSPDAGRLVPKLTAVLDAKDKAFKNVLQRLNQLGRAELVNPDAAQPQSFEDTLNRLSDSIKQAVKRIEYIQQQDERKWQYDRLVIILRALYGPLYAQKQAEQLPQVSFKLSKLQEDEWRQADLILRKVEQEHWSIEKKIERDFYSAVESAGGLTAVLSALKADVSMCKGEETAASVDSELSMVLHPDYDLYRWQKNDLQDMPLWLPSKTLMVARLDGPSSAITAGLVDKAIEAEKKGLLGGAYIDTRGLPVVEQPTPYSLEFFDQSMLTLADILKKRTSMTVVVEKTSSLFAPGSCPKTAIYCGWYSVKKYIDSFDFVPGAVGYHIASFEAMDLRNPSSSNWCPAMLSHGVTATLGTVEEPYLLSFPQPDKFFSELLDGKSLVEAFYRTNPFNSWQLVLIGDPLYKLNVK
jgi:uncharacterized protein (TIGR03790 family)